MEIQQIEIIQIHPDFATEVDVFDASRFNFGDLFRLNRRDAEPNNSGDFVITNRFVRCEPYNAVVLSGEERRTLIAHLSFFLSIQIETERNTHEITTNLSSILSKLNEMEDHASEKESGP